MVCMSDNPKVSVIIPFYNCPYIDQAIESVLQQSYPSIQLIVVDDGSTKYNVKIEPYMKYIRYIKKANGGTGSALNAGINQAEGEYFAWLSSDDLFNPIKVEKQVSFMVEKNAYASYTNYVLIDPHNEVISKLVGVSFPSKLRFLEAMRRGCFINGCTVMLNMKVFDEIGHFNPRLKYTQDYDLWLRVVGNYDFHYLHDPLVKRRVHPEMGTRKYESTIQKEILYVQKKHRDHLEALIRKEKKLK
jgi:glycosyltransferase involved in cell wall biosynthesis